MFSGWFNIDEFQAITEHSFITTTADTFKATASKLSAAHFKMHHQNYLSAKPRFFRNLTYGEKFYSIFLLYTGFTQLPNRI